MTLLAWLGCAVLGGTGSLARFLLDGYVSDLASGGFPFGTFAINMSGSFLLGMIDGAALSGTALTLIGTATIGSFTTFSTWMLETHRLREDGEFIPLMTNALLSLFVGFGAVAVGHWAAAR